MAQRLTVQAQQYSISTQSVSFPVFLDTLKWALHQDDVWKTALGVAKISNALVKMKYNGLPSSFNSLL